MSPSSNAPSRARWTIAELSERVGAALAVSGYQAPANGQVRAVPDLRTIRYYTSLGLLDRPVEMRGRTALYGPRHLYQLCAIKRLQAEGKALGEVQASLAGLDDRGLARIAQVPAEAMVAEPESPAVAESPARRAGAFWSAAPAAVTRSPVDRDDRASPVRPVPARIGSQIKPDDPVGPAPAARFVHTAKIQLCPGVQLEIAPVLGAFDPTRGSDDAAALRRAAAPLLEELRRQGLIPGSHQEERE